MRWVALLGAAGLALTACSAGGSDESGDSVPHSSSSQAGGDSDSAQPESGATSGSAAQDTSKASGSNNNSSGYKAPTDAHIARTASLSLTVKNIEESSAKVRSAARTSGGYVSQEDSRAASYEGGRSWAEITVTVPVAELDATTNTLTEIGEVTKRASSAEDLTSQYTDTAARVRTKTKAVKRLRALIDTTDDLQQIVTLEDELATREADLESMTSQQQSLEKRTATAPITVSLSTETVEVDDASDEDATGFLAGLRSGWDSFTSALSVGLTALGAITPFAVTAMVFLAPFVWWLRRRSARPAPAVTTSGE